MVATQYKKNMDIADMHTSGRAIMRIIERDIRMAGFEYRDKDAKITYGTISSPLTIKDSGNKCCDEVTVIYDYFDEESKKAERVRIRYWAEPHTSNKGSRYRLYKQKDILGQNKKIIAKPKLGTKEVMADYIEDLQLVGLDTSTSNGGYIKLDKNGKELSDNAKNWSCVKDKKTGLIWEVKTKTSGVHYKDNKYRWGGVTATYGYGGIYYNDWNLLVNSSNNNTLCRQTDWRVPSRGELLDFVIYGKKNFTEYTKFFPNKSSNFGQNITSWFWSSTPNHPLSAWVSTYIGKFTDVGSSRSVYGQVRLVSATSLTQVQVFKLVGINLTLRTKNQYGKDRQFKKKNYHAGNYKLDKTDKYKRDTFSSTVLVRNLAL
jgi:hypothetical protein